MAGLISGDKFLTLILAISLFFGVPIIIILSLPLFLIRYLVKKSAKYVNPSLGKMVTTRSSALTADGIYQRPEANACSETILEGNVDVEKARELIGQRISEARFGNGDLKYPELKQYVTTWCGYWFFRDDPDFDFKNHIKIHEKCTGEGDHFTQDDVDDFHEEALNKRWERRRPLWELTFIPNCFRKDLKDPGPHTILFMTVHHALSDGFSGAQLIIKGICLSDIKFPQPNYVKRSLCSSILFGTTFPFFAPYELAEAVMLSFKKLPLRTSKKQTGKYFIKRTKLIPIQKLKEIKDYFNVSFSSVLYAVAGGAFREFFIKNQMDVPTALPGITLQPLANHTEKLRNSMTAIIIKFPTGESDPETKLKMCQKNFESQKLSTTPIIGEYLPIIVGSYFACIIKYIGYNFAIPTGITNFPGANEYPVFNGAKQHKYLDQIFSVGPQRGICGIAICAKSFVGGFRFMLVGDSEVLSKNDLTDLSQLIQNQIDILYDQLTINKV